jgi:hypothetical protein
MSAKTEISADSLTAETGNQMPQGAAVEMDHTQLKISFHGQIIDHLRRAPEDERLTDLAKELGYIVADLSKE